MDLVEPQTPSTGGSLPIVVGLIYGERRLPQAVRGFCRTGRLPGIEVDLAVAACSCSHRPCTCPEAGCFLSSETYRVHLNGKVDLLVSQKPRPYSRVWRFASGSRNDLALSLLREAALSHQCEKVGIDGRAPPGVEPAARFDSSREISPRTQPRGSGSAAELFSAGFPRLRLSALVSLVCDRPCQLHHSHYNLSNNRKRRRIRLSSAVTSLGRLPLSSRFSGGWGAERASALGSSPPLLFCPRGLGFRFPISVEVLKR